MSSEQKNEEVLQDCNQTESQIQIESSINNNNDLKNVQKDLSIKNLLEQLQQKISIWISDEGLEEEELEDQEYLKSILFKKKVQIVEEANEHSSELQDSDISFHEDFDKFQLKFGHRIDHLSKKSIIQIKQFIQNKICKDMKVLENEKYKNVQHQHLINASVDKFKKMQDKMDTRLNVVEKVMTFNNIHRDQINILRLENILEQKIVDMYTPTQQRVLELQNKMGDLAELVQVKVLSQVSDMQRIVESTIGTPKQAGTFKTSMQDLIKREFTNLEHIMHQQYDTLQQLNLTNFQYIEAQRLKTEKWQELQAISNHQIQELQLQIPKNLSVYNDMMNEQRNHFNNQLYAFKLQTEGWDRKILEQDNKMKEYLQLIEDHKQLLNEMNDKINQNSYLIRQTKTEVQEFKRDDVYQQSRQNYLKVYQEIVKNREYMENDVVPMLKQVKIDKNFMVRHQDLQVIYQKIDEQTVRIKDQILDFSQKFESTSALQNIQNEKIEQLESFKEKISDLEKQVKQLITKRKVSFSNPYQSAIQKQGVKSSQEKSPSGEYQNIHFQEGSLQDINSSDKIQRTVSNFTNTQNYSLRNSSFKKVRNPDFLIKLNQQLLEKEFQIENIKEDESKREFEVSFSVDQQAFKENEYANNQKDNILQQDNQQMFTNNQSSTSSSAKCLYNPEEFQQYSQNIQTQFDQYLLTSQVEKVVTPIIQQLVQQCKQELDVKLQRDIMRTENLVQEKKQQIEKQQQLEFKQLESKFSDQIEKLEQYNQKVQFDMKREYKLRSDMRTKIESFGGLIKRQDDNIKLFSLDCIEKFSSMQGQINFELLELQSAISKVQLTLKNSYMEGKKRYKKKPNESSTDDIIVPKRMNIIFSKNGNSQLDYIPKQFQKQIEYRQMKTEQSLNLQNSQNQNNEKTQPNNLLDNFQPNSDKINIQKESEQPIIQSNDLNVNINQDNIINELQEKTFFSEQKDKEILNENKNSDSPSQKQTIVIKSNPLKIAESLFQSFQNLQKLNNQSNKSQETKDLSTVQTELGSKKLSILNSKKQSVIQNKIPENNLSIKNGVENDQIESQKQQISELSAQNQFQLNHQKKLNQSFEKFVNTGQKKQLVHPLTSKSQNHRILIDPNNYIQKKTEDKDAQNKLSLSISEKQKQINKMSDALDDRNLQMINDLLQEQLKQSNSHSFNTLHTHFSIQNLNIYKQNDPKFDSKTFETDKIKSGVSQFNYQSSRYKNSQSSAENNFQNNLVNNQNLIFGEYNNNLTQRSIQNQQKSLQNKINQTRTVSANINLKSMNNLSKINVNTKNSPMKIVNTTYGNISISQNNLNQSIHANLTNDSIEKESKFKKNQIQQEFIQSSFEKLIHMQNVFNSKKQENKLNQKNQLNLLNNNQNQSRNIESGRRIPVKFDGDFMQQAFATQQNLSNLKTKNYFDFNQKEQGSNQVAAVSQFKTQNNYISSQDIMKVSDTQRTTVYSQKKGKLKQNSQSRKDYDEESYQDKINNSRKYKNESILQEFKPQIIQSNPIIQDKKIKQKRILSKNSSRKQ